MNPMGSFSNVTPHRLHGLQFEHPRVVAEPRNRSVVHIRRVNRCQVDERAARNGLNRGGHRDRHHGGAEVVRAGEQDIVAEGDPLRGRESADVLQ